MVIFFTFDLKHTWIRCGTPLACVLQIASAIAWNTTRFLSQLVARSRQSRCPSKPSGCRRQRNIHSCSHAAVYVGRWMHCDRQNKQAGRMSAVHHDQNFNRWRQKEFRSSPTASLGLSEKMTCINNVILPPMFPTYQRRRRKICWDPRKRKTRMRKINLPHRHCVQRAEQR